MVAANQYGTAGFTEGLDLLKKSAAAGCIEAQAILGHIHAQISLLPNAASEAVHWYEAAAQHGHPMAQDRLADLHMLGRGVAQNDCKAFDWYARTATQAYAMAQCNLAYMQSEGLGTKPDEVAATTLYLKAAAQGEARAYFNLGLRCATGVGTPWNLVQASAWMANAARLDYPSSGTELALLMAELTEPERNQASELGAAIERNFTTLQRVLDQVPGTPASTDTYRHTVEENFALLAVTEFSLDPEKRQLQSSSIRAPHRPGPHSASQSMVICEQPRVFTVDEFVSKGEAAHLMAAAAVHLRSAREDVRDPLSREQTAFTGHAAIFHTSICDAVIRNVERRIAAAFALSPAHVEPLSVLRYRPSDRYLPHVDYFDANRLQYNDRIGDHSGQRVASFLVYLLPPEAGGATHYLKRDLKVHGRSRMALCHYNCLPTGEADPLTLHTGEAVTSGEKWLARTTLREKPLY